jgi:hypothetical protein
MLVLLVAIAARGVAVYESCDPAADTTDVCHVLATFADHPYCCASQMQPTLMQVMGVDCYDLAKTPTPCPVVVAITDSAAWCCSGPLDDSDDYTPSEDDMWDNMWSDEPYDGSFHWDIPI